MSKLAARSPVKRAAQSVSGHRPRFAASTAHSQTTNAVNRSAQRKCPVKAAAGSARIEPAVIVHTAVCKEIDRRQKAIGMKNPSKRVVAA